MPEFEIGDEVTTAGQGADDEPIVGERRQIVHYSGLVLATYEVTAVWPPVVMGALWRLTGRVVDVGDETAV